MSKRGGATLQRRANRARIDTRREEEELLLQCADGYTRSKPGDTLAHINQREARWWKEGRASRGYSEGPPSLTPSPPPSLAQDAREAFQQGLPVEGRLAKGSQGRGGASAQLLWGGQREGARRATRGCRLLRGRSTQARIVGARLFERSAHSGGVGS